MKNKILKKMALTTNIRKLNIDLKYVLYITKIITQSRAKMYFIEQS